jgi:hypothetical protein
VINSDLTKSDVSIHGATAGFAGTVDLQRYESQATYPADHGFYVLSPRGNVLEFWAWPRSLKREEQIVGKLLAAKRF